VKIISKETDYYDSIVYKHGFDDSVLFIRKTGRPVELSDKHHDISNSLKPLTFEKKINISKYGFLSDMVSGIINIQPIVFCGKVFFCEKTRFGTMDSDKFRTENGFSSEAIGKNWFRFLTKEDLIEYLVQEDKLEKRTNFWRGHKSEVLQGYIEIYDKDFTEILIELRAAYFTFESEFSYKYDTRKHAPDLHPLLKKYEFAKAVEPYSAAQQLEQFISSALTGNNEPPVILADKYRVTAHGFDKYSFRNMPAK